MKAIVNHEYGPPGVLALEDVDVPVMRRDEVLVRVLAAAVNPGDWDVMHGTPYVLRLTTGLRRPRNKVLGLSLRETAATPRPTGVRRAIPIDLTMTMRADCGRRRVAG